MDPIKRPPYKPRIKHRGFASKGTPNYFGEILREVRLEKKLSQIEAAALFDTSQALWSAYERGKIKPNLDTIFSIAQALDLDPMTFLKQILRKRKSMLG